MKTEHRPSRTDVQVEPPNPSPTANQFWSTAEIEIQSYMALSAARALTHERTESGITTDDFLLYMRSRKVEELVERYIRTCRELARETNYLHRRVRRLSDDTTTDAPLEVL